jgi:predicted nucleotidyltransferase component of viral defense system
MAKSVHTRLLTLAKGANRPFNEVLQLYAMERFLYRLSRSTHEKKFVLKGGLMLRVWRAPVSRPTKDLDLLGRTANTIENITEIVREVCVEVVETDGLNFDPETIIGTLIKEDAEYNGIRVKFTAVLGVARVPMQIDVGFGDSVVPKPIEIEVPTLLDFPAPKLRGYQRETTIAEKFHAMVILGTINGRMKDFYDIWLLASHFDFDGAELANAMRATFKTRATELDLDPIALTPTFAGSDDPQKRWTAFLRKSALSGAPADFTEVARVIRDLLLPALQAKTPKHWRPGGPWS